MVLLPLQIELSRGRRRGKPVADSTGWRGASAATEGRRGLAAANHNRTYPRVWPAAASGYLATAAEGGGLNDGDDGRQRAVGLGSA